jgi:hypothetical protein
MSTGESRAERQDRMLDEFADLAMELGRDMAGRAKKAETDEQRERCIFTFDRMYRAVRLSIALSRRLKRDEAREQSHHRAEAVDLRKAKLRARLRSEIRAEDVSLKIRCDLERELDDRLAEDALYQSFLDLPLDEAIHRLRDKLGLVPPPGRSPIEGEVDRAERREPEGVAAHSHLSGLQPPHPVSPGAPPEGEHLGGPALKPAPS